MAAYEALATPSQPRMITAALLQRERNASATSSHRAHTEMRSFATVQLDGVASSQSGTWVHVLGHMPERASLAYQNILRAVATT